MSRARFSIMALAALLVIVLIFPDIGAAVRDWLASLFSDVAARVIGVLAGLATIAALILPPLVRTIRERGGPSTGTSTTRGPEVDAVRAVRTEAREMARRLQAFVADRRAGSPINQYPGANLPLEGTPEHEKLDAEEDAYVRETYQLYTEDLRDEVVSVRYALADIGMRDPELDRLYPRPHTYLKLEALAARLNTIADRL